MSAGVGANAPDFREIVAEVHPKGKAPRRVRFTGRWLVGDVVLGDWLVSVALTESGQLLTFSVNQDDSRWVEYYIDGDHAEFVTSWSGGAGGADDLLAEVADALGLPHYVDL